MCQRSWEEVMNELVVTYDRIAQDYRRKRAALN
jgi:hypothetical protein